MVDYWKDVPGIDELIESPYSNLKTAAMNLNTISKAIAKAVTNADKGRGSDTAIVKQVKLLKKITYDLGVEAGKLGVPESAKLKLKKKLTEAGGVDSSYLQRSLEILADDFKRGVKEEKALVPILRHIESRLNQSFPDGDVTSADIRDLLKEVAARSAVKKSGMSIPDLVDMIMDVQ